MCFRAMVLSYFATYMGTSCVKVSQSNKFYSIGIICPL